MSGVEFYEQSYKISSVNCFIKMGAHGTIERPRDPLTGLATVSEMINWSTGCTPACLNERESVQWGWGIVEKGRVMDCGQGYLSLKFMHFACHCHVPFATYWLKRKRFKDFSIEP